MSDLFDTLPSAPERQRMILEKALEARREAWTREGYAYRGGGDLLLRHGEFFSGRVLPAEYSHLVGEMGHCFRNALIAAEENPSLTYVEGVYSLGGSGHYTPHAWCLDPDGQLLEVTFPTTEWERAGNAETGRPYLSPETWGYWGVRLHVQFVRACLNAIPENEDPSDPHIWGSFDRPVQDARHGANYTDMRDDWPILRVPYDKDRRSL